MDFDSLYIFLPIILWPLVAVLFTKISRANGSLLLSFYRQLGITLVGLPLLFFLPIPYDLINDYMLEIVLANFFGSLYVFVTFLGR